MWQPQPYETVSTSCRNPPKKAWSYEALQNPARAPKKPFKKRPLKLLQPFNHFLPSRICFGSSSRLRVALLPGGLSEWGSHKATDLGVARRLPLKGYYKHTSWVTIRVKVYKKGLEGLWRGGTGSILEGLLQRSDKVTRRIMEGEQM